jgi:deoxyribodipyrimidine photolyase-related protein
MSGTTLVMVLGDQLSHGLSALKAADPANTIILMTEVMEEATSVRHHKRKIAFLFSAMRHFANELAEKGCTVLYVKLDDPDNSGSFTGELLRAVEAHKPARLVLTEPSEWRVKSLAETWDEIVPTTILPDDRFLASHAEFEAWAEGRKALRMEYFYRDMRRKTGLLMNGEEPEGGQWNFDHDNRKAASRDLLMPHPPRFAPDAITQEVLSLVETRFADHFGSLDGYWYAATRTQALEALAWFCKEALPKFGDFQDAMLRDEKFLYHSLLSQYLNCGLLTPLEICQAVEAEYHAGRAPINAAEGYIRQIIGWREYVRGIYWREGPDYAERNALDANRPLPAFYWTADTQMSCIKACVEQTRDEAYAHHIQRLMVTGTFGLIAGINPHELHEWYLAVYADAFEWVEVPNVVGMSQFADGGLLASKPYAASGAYIDRMSDYCGGCAYKVKLKAGEKACPFNYLYWDFISRHEDRFVKNPRMAQMVRTYQRMTDERKAEIRGDSEKFLATILS